ncbi:MAG: acetyl-CoA carboxylase biotin carboxyl carrier protein subunit [Vicinamibacterales bacterium]
MMQLQIEVNGRLRTVDISQQDGLYRVVVDGVERVVDAAAVDASTFSLIWPDNGRSSHEVGLSPTGLPGEIAVHMPAGVASAKVLTGAASRFGRGAGAAQAAGTQQVLAPMPGRVVKLLVRAGDEVKARQGLVVVEAMKMENELRSPKDGRVIEVLVAEGASVEAGRPLVVVE